MLRPLPALCLLALCTLVALPAAQAQAGANDPKVTVALEVKPTSATIPLGGSQSFLVNVKLTTTNIFCPSPGGTMTVTLAAPDSGLPGVTGNLPTTLDVPIAANVAPPMATANSAGNNTASFLVAVAASAGPDHDHTFVVTANTPATTPKGCQTLSASMPAAATATVNVAVRTGPAMAMSGTSGVSISAGPCAANVSAPGVTVNAAASCPTSKKAFFVPLQLELAILLAVGLLRRR